MPRRLPSGHRRLLEVEVARMRRTDALDALDLAATVLASVRARDHVDPVEVVAAEARVETARLQFWRADHDYNRLLDGSRRSTGTTWR